MERRTWIAFFDGARGWDASKRVLQSPELVSTDLAEGLKRIITLKLIVSQGKREFFSKLLLRDVLLEILLEDATHRLICSGNNRAGRCQPDAILECIDPATAEPRSAANALTIVASIANPLCRPNEY